jgi:hypothetical protein
MVVINISGKPLEITEIQKVLPFDGKMRILPEGLARKYSEFLKPVQKSDTPPPVQMVAQRKYKATVVEIDLDSIIAEEFQPKKLNIIKEETEPTVINNVVKPLAGKSINKKKLKEKEVEVANKKR